MWDRRKLNLAAIIFTALYYKETAESATPLELDMAPDAVDDMYSGCRNETLEKFIHSGLLKQELIGSKTFQKAWNANTQCSKLLHGKQKEHTSALMAYVNADETFKNKLDHAVKTSGVNVSFYEDHFHFKSLHFLLMDSMTLLSPNQCKTMYVLSEKQYKAQKGSNVRLGRFTEVQSSYNELKDMQDLDEVVIFNITSCFLVNLGDICSEKDSALISPAEVFTVEEIKEIAHDDQSYTEIVLKHSKLYSSHNCYIFSRSPADVSTQWLVLVLVALSLFFP
ncbi:ecto-ADP-ribosyltransferase 5 isoform X1 [Micropterus salmoides]|uniref:ecto-ADP-ribosyltransferase 5 isoform X1 n=2 Tax=Micropterus salmoides TaxID=27706 RepID=UPI0018EA7916|nr:ecto-ADP-ribosyltransferase 5 isoform X1 [Micropterus salmoides]